MTLPTRMDYKVDRLSRSLHRQCNDYVSLARHAGKRTGKVPSSKIYRTGL